MKRKAFMTALAITLVSIAGIVWAVTTTDPYPSARTAGQAQVGGRLLSLQVLESILVHPTHADGFADTGDPVIVGGAAGNLIGVARTSAAAATDNVTVDTDGIWNLAVTPGAGLALTANVTQKVYINTSTAVLQTSPTTGLLFGYSLSRAAVTSPSTTVVPIRLALPGN